VSEYNRAVEIAKMLEPAELRALIWVLELLRDGDLTDG
jgi:hypothetical protein